MATLPTLLNPQPQDTKEELTRRFRILAARIHPDKNEAPGAHLAFIKLKDEFEAALPSAPSQECQKKRAALDEKRLTCHVRKRKGWSQHKSKGAKPEVQPVLAIQDDMQILIQAQDLHRENGVPPQNLSKKMKHYRWEQAMLLRKADKNAAQHAKEAKAAEKQAEKDETIRQVRRRVKRANFGYEEGGLCPTYIPEELKDRFVVAANISEEESEANDAEMDEPLSFVSWLVSFFASCPCVGR